MMSGSCVFLIILIFILLVWLPQACSCVCITQWSPSDWSEVVLKHFQPAELPASAGRSVGAPGACSKSGSSQVCPGFSSLSGPHGSPCSVFAAYHPAWSLIWVFYHALISRISPLNVWLACQSTLHPNGDCILRLQSCGIPHLFPTRLGVFTESFTGHQ